MERKNTLVATLMLVNILMISVVAMVFSPGLMAAPIMANGLKANSMDMA